jgi:aminobenzoyl-glutamate utilization protein B
MIAYKSNIVNWGVPRARFPSLESAMNSSPNDPKPDLAGSLSRRDMLGIATTAAAVAGVAFTTTQVAGQGEPKAPTKPPIRESLKAAQAVVKTVEKTIVKISREVWDLPAVGLKEQEAMEVHIRELEAAGFKITARKAGGHPTAFIAEWSQGVGGPKLGFLPEYDALPGLGNAAEPQAKPAPNGKTDGHGCGHNCLGAGCTGAAIALKAMMEAKKTPGTLRVYGCGAEENYGAKVFMAKAGLFDDLDAALAWHPTPVAVTGTVMTAANRKIRVSWKGKTAHAGNTPWDGRSALDAAELFAHGVNLMREHVEPTARLHYIYEVAGVAPNIVPDDARIWMIARDATSAKASATTEWLKQLADGAALGTQTKATFDVPIGSAEMIPNETLAMRVLEHLQHTPLEWSADEQAFAKSCQKAMGVKEAGMATQVMPLLKDVRVGGSSDVADVSWNTPVVLFGWPTHPLGVSAHTWAVTACGGMSIGDKGSLASATILAAVGYDLLTEAELRKAAKEEWKKRLDGRKYEGVLNMDPKTLDESARRFGKGPGEEIVTDIEGK